LVKKKQQAESWFFDQLQTTNCTGFNANSAHLDLALQLVSIEKPMFYIFGEKHKIRKIADT